MQDIHCLAHTQVEGTWSLWCGGSEGIMSVFSMRSDGLVIGQDTVSHFSSSHCQTPSYSPGDTADVLILCAPENPLYVHSHLRQSLWSYVYPGKYL